MIYGIGIDIVVVKCLQDMWECYGDRVLKWVFVLQEIDDFFRVVSKGCFFVKCFVVKEVFSKVFGIGFRLFVVLLVIVVSYDELGKLIFSFCGGLVEMIENQGFIVYFLLSDEVEYVIVYVILECV